MAFKRRSQQNAVPEDPEALYRHLSRTNNGPDSPWGHQTDLLRDWHAHFKSSSDVALELPTGAGKTLVGGLIAEWVRLSERQPVTYVCPTRQLAAQAVEELRSYGLESVLLTGQVRSWDAASRAKYSSAGAVAVSTYSHLFNSNPALAGAGTLILDDAHAGEQLVASAWSLEILRSEQAYITILQILSHGLNQDVVAGLFDDDSPQKHKQTVYLVSPEKSSKASNEIEQALAAAVRDEKIDPNKRYTLSALSGHLGRCLIYASHRRILIRPLISPTGSHPTFDEPGRRVYMSATLGAGGELERAFGRTKIDRMPIPRGWDKQGTGRRFFVFPELTTDIARDPSLLGPWLSSTISKHGRAALVTPAKRVSDAVVELGAVPEGYKRLDGHDVENDISLFTGTKTAILDLPNRYDGINLPDENCRLVILAGLPSQGDLQERFLYESLGAGSVLQERVRARIVQGAGRATRNAKDFATVIVISNELTNFIVRGDVLDALREELQAEIAFGRDQSLETSISEVDDNIDQFLKQSEDWLSVEEDILVARDERIRKDPYATAALSAAAPAEVRATQAWWEGDLDTALTEAGKVIDELSSDPKAARYAALWHYLTATWLKELASEKGDPSGSLSAFADSKMSEARVAGRGTTWVAHLLSCANVTARADEYDYLDRLAAGKTGELLNSWSSGNNRRELQAAKAGLSQAPYKAYESGLVTLGRYLGATESFGSGKAQAAPDSTWIFGDQLWVCWEAKSEASATSNIAAGKVREACGHLNFVEGKRDEQAPASSFTCYATPQIGIDQAARFVADDNLYHVSDSAAYGLLLRIEGALEKANGFQARLDEAELLGVLKEYKCLPSQWVVELTSQPMSSLGGASTNAG